MTADEILNNIFFGYFFTHEAIQVIFPLGLLALVFIGFVYFFVHDWKERGGRD